ncbi:type IV secretory system conjugative DNA transfer family protein [Caballeronia sp. TF1N1]|uniref:type IV secretory system conjugative DNA transfer family protein n=1 Tax=Caballeronia sp. TF1N1 TaxID=2878153 RepID=UPI001FD59902|nr:type IV secretory system conjugative DNA transfer family protein [Caballeronia sp. TF1N1]
MYSDAARLKPSHALFGDVPRGDPDREPWNYAPPGACFTSPLDLAADEGTLWKKNNGRLFLGVVEGVVNGTPGDRYTTAGIPIGIDDDRHICTFAGSRAGKGRSMIIPNMLYYPGSVLATDPKGELAAITARRRHEMGQNVHVLDPFPSPSTIANSFAHRNGRVAGFNPIEAIRPGREVEDAALIADALVLTEENSDPHWNESAQSFIEGVILHVATYAKYQERRNLFTVQELVVRGIPDNSDKAIGGYTVTALCDEMMANKAANGVIESAGSSLASKPAKERESVLSTARRHLKFMDLFRQTPTARRTLEHHGFSLGSLKLEPTTIYLCLPARHMGTCSRWLRLFVNLTMQAMEQTEAVEKHGPGGAPVLFCLDEFASLGHLKQLEDAAGQIAGFGVKLWPVLQDIGQLRTLYKNRWETFLGNAGVLQFFGNTDLGTLEWINKRCGRTSVRERTDKPVTADQAAKSQTGESWKTTVYDLLGIDEAARLFSRDDRLCRQLIFWGGLPPFITQRVQYDRHELFKGLWDERPSTLSGGK